MLKSTSKFIETLRKDKIHSPAVRSFTEAEWRRDYASLGTDSEEERAVFNAGLWVAPRLQRLWSQIDRLDITRFDFESVVTILMLIAVREYHRHSEPLPKGRPSPLSADYGCTALGDALWRALSFLASKRNEFRGEAKMDVGVAASLLKHCATIYVLEYMMSRVVHCGWQLEHTAEGHIFRPRSSTLEFANNEAIALASRDEEYLEFYLVFRQAWDQGQLRDEAPFQPRLISRTPTRAKFRIVNKPPVEMPATIALFKMDIPDWLRPMMETEPQNLPGISVAQLVRAWLLIHTIFEKIYDRDTRNGSADYATTSLHEDDLLAIFLLHKYPRRIAEALIKFFTYDWRRHESLWTSPLVKVGHLFYPFLPSVMSPNMTRLLDLWLGRCKYVTDKGNLDTLQTLRGSIFEKHIRTTLAHYFEKNPNWDGHIYPLGIEIDGNEIDLLWRLGSTIFVGEAKFMKYPANPNEIGNYFRELEHGAEQASKRVAALQSNRIRIAELLKWEGKPEEMSFQPCVVCGHAVGSGLSFGGVPCIQFDMLEMFFREEQYGMSRSSAGDRDIALPLPKSHNLAKMAALFLNNPPDTWFRKKAIKTAAVLGCEIGEEKVYFEHRTADIPRTTEREIYSRERLTKWLELLAEHNGVRGGSAPD